MNGQKNRSRSACERRRTSSSMRWRMRSGRRTCPSVCRRRRKACQAGRDDRRRRQPRQAGSRRSRKTGRAPPRHSSHWPRAAARARSLDRGISVASFFGSATRKRRGAAFRRRHPVHRGRGGLRFRRDGHSDRAARLPAPAVRPARSARIARPDRRLSDRRKGRGRQEREARPDLRRPRQEDLGMAALKGAGASQGRKQAPQSRPGRHGRVDRA